MRTGPLRQQQFCVALHPLGSQLGVASLKCRPFGTLLYVQLHPLFVAPPIRDVPTVPDSPQTAR